MKSMIFRFLSLSACIISAMVFLSAFLVSCSVSLDPAWKLSGKTAAALNFSRLKQPSPSSRAVIQGCGFLYIQTVDSTGTAKLYGPYAVSTGTTFGTKEISAGPYPEMQVFCRDVSGC